jgi:hypothetical protein
MDLIIPNISDYKGFLTKDIIAKIKRNIANNNTKDVKEHRSKGTLTMDEFFDKIKEQGNKCYVCLQEFKYDGGKWCYFFPSADRIYNYTSHTKDNIAASCLFCNIRMFKQTDRKQCGLCDGLNHNYEGDIITKSKLFRELGNSNYRIKEYIDDINKTSEELAAKKENKLKDIDTDHYSE